MYKYSLYVDGSSCDLLHMEPKLCGSGFVQFTVKITFITVVATTPLRCYSRTLMNLNLGFIEVRVIIAVLVVLLTRSTKIVTKQYSMRTRYAPRNLIIHVCRTNCNVEQGG